jgi:hypothetical protein
MVRRVFAPVLAFGLAVTVSAAPQQPPAQDPPPQMTVWVPHSIAPEKIDTGERPSTPTT